jgi:hypothetical protein
MPKQLSKAEMFYIESNYFKMNEKLLAKDLGVSVQRVRSYVNKLKKAGMKPTEPEHEKQTVQKSKTPAEKGGFVVKNGAVVMTESASVRGDEASKHNIPPKIKNNVFVDPSFEGTS